MKNYLVRTPDGDFLSPAPFFFTPLAAYAQRHTRWEAKHVAINWPGAQVCRVDEVQLQPTEPFYSGEQCAEYFDRVA